MRKKNRQRRKTPTGWEAERLARLREHRRKQQQKIPGPFPVLKRDGTEKKSARSSQHLKYEAYIQSKRWEQRKTAYYRLHAKECWRCGVTVKIHLHHHTYIRLGQEWDDDLVPLCESCHDRVHAIHKTERRLSLTEATIAALNETPKGAEHKIVLR